MDCRCLVGKNDWQQHEGKRIHELEQDNLTQMDQQNMQREKVKDLEVALREEMRWKRTRRTWGHGKCDGKQLPMNQLPRNVVNTN